MNTENRDFRAELKKLLMSLTDAHRVNEGDSSLVDVSDRLCFKTCMDSWPVLTINNFKVTLTAKEAVCLAYLLRTDIKAWIECTELAGEDFREVTG